MARNKYDIDEVIEDKFDLNQLKRVFQYVKPYRVQLAIALFLMLSASALTMLFPMFISEIMDTYIPEKNIRAIVIITALSLIIVLYTCVCIRLKIRITSRIGQAIVFRYLLSFAGATFLLLRRSPSWKDTSARGQLCKQFKRFAFKWYYQHHY